MFCFLICSMSQFGVFRFLMFTSFISVRYLTVNVSRTLNIFSGTFDSVSFSRILITFCETFYC